VISTTDFYSHGIALARELLNKNVCSTALISVVEHYSSILISNKGSYQQYLIALLVDHSSSTGL